MSKRELPEGAEDNEQEKKSTRSEQSEDGMVFTTKDDPRPLIPDGKYQVIFVRAEKRRYFGDQKLYVIFEICDGPQLGVWLFKSFNYEEPLGRGTDLYKTLVMLHKRRVPKKAKLSLSLFKNKVLEVKVRTVTADRNQDPIPEHQRYSVISRILGILVGGEA